MTTNTLDESTGLDQLSRFAAIVTLVSLSIAIGAGFIATVGDFTWKAAIGVILMIVVAGFVGVGISLFSDDMGQWNDRLETQGYALMMAISVLLVGFVLWFALTGSNGWYIWGSIASAICIMVATIFNTGIWQSD